MTITVQKQIASIRKKSIIKFNVEKKGLTLKKANELFNKYYYPKKFEKIEYYYHQINELNLETDLSIPDDHHISTICKYGFHVDNYIKSLIEEMNHNYISLSKKKDNLLTIESCENSGGYTRIFFCSNIFSDWIKLLLQMCSRLKDFDLKKKFCSRQCIQFVNDLIDNVSHKHNNLTSSFMIVDNNEFNSDNESDNDSINHQENLLVPRAFIMISIWKIPRDKVDYYTKNFKMLNKLFKELDNYKDSN
jgi:hypothetical protein